MPPSQQQTCDNQLFSNRTAVFSWNPLFSHQTSLPIYPLRCALIAVAQFEWIMIRKKSVATPSCKISSNIDFLQHLIGMRFLQEHSPSGWFDLQEAGPSGWSIATTTQQQQQGVVSCITYSVRQVCLFVVSEHNVTCQVVVSCRSFGSYCVLWFVSLLFVCCLWTCCKMSGCGELRSLLQVCLLFALFVCLFRSLFVCWFVCLFENML